MKVLMLSTDRTILDPTSRAAERMQRYASRLGWLHIVVYGAGEGREIVLGPSCTVHMAGGIGRLHAYIAYIRLARRLATEHAVQVVSAQDPAFVGCAGILAARAARARLEMQIHTSIFSPAYRTESLQRMVEFLIALVALRGADCVRTVSEELRIEVQKYTKRPVTVLPIAPPPFVAGMPRPKELVAAPAVLVVSRLTKEKRLDRVLRTMAEIPDAHLYILGDGPLRKRLESLSFNLRLGGRVHFLGWVQDPRPFYQHADCFVQSSRYEGYGLSLVEALRSGVPVVTTAVGVVRELPAGAVTVVSDHEYDLLRAIRTTLDSIPEARRRQNAARAGFLSALLTEDAFADRVAAHLSACVSS